jgi:hypothetical protein
MMPLTIKLIKVSIFLIVLSMFQLADGKRLGKGKDKSELYRRYP